VSVINYAISHRLGAMDVESFFTDNGHALSDKGEAARGVALKSLQHEQVGKMNKICNR